jgi:hypothetical protein
MFQASKLRLRALLAVVDDVLGDPEPQPNADPGTLSVVPHPHRQPVRIKRVRRPGAVPTRHAYCLSPVRHQVARGRERVS